MCEVVKVLSFNSFKSFSLRLHTTNTRLQSRERGAQGRGGGGAAGGTDMSP